MLYKQKDQFDSKLFENPSKEYRAAPFWAWNCKLSKDFMRRQIKIFKKMGFGGFFMHSRTGMASTYLGEEFMEMVKFCTETAKEEQLLAWLYDEDRWPSGSAGGLVTREHRFRGRQLHFTPKPYADRTDRKTAEEEGGHFLLACYDVALDEQGGLETYSMISENENAAGMKWYAYIRTREPEAWFNHQAYADTLNGDAVKRFIEITYSAYERTVGEEFGGTVPAIFTDEPQFCKKSTLDFEDSMDEVVFPWTVGFDQLFYNRFGFSIVEQLPEIIWELPKGKISRARYCYHECVAEQFAAAFADNCGRWCKAHGIALTGHVMGEGTLFSQTAAVGDAMRSYRSFGIIGVDILRNEVELATLKQAQSAAHQYGHHAMLSELYGVTSWDFDFRGYKFQGDWQAALGVTVRVPHLAWMSMEGEAKRDFPASISYQSPWYTEYGCIENHFARLGVVLSRGKPTTEIAVIHPIESYWLHWGPKSSTAAVRDALESRFQDLIRWLLFGSIDFDFISEGLLLTQGEVRQENTLNVGAMRYKTIIVPACETLRDTTVERLKAFRDGGGRLIFMGACPKLIDAAPSEMVFPLFHRSEQIPFSKYAVQAALKTEKKLAIRYSDGTPCEKYVHTLRQDHDCMWLFIARGIAEPYQDHTVPEDIVITIKGEYEPVLFNTQTGKAEKISFSSFCEKTELSCRIYASDSILLQLNPASNKAYTKNETERNADRTIDFKTKVRYVVDEPNALLLDMAEFALDGGEFQPCEELLKLDNKAREQLGLPKRIRRIAQPWAVKEEGACHLLKLRFCIESEIDVENPKLAMEKPESCAVEWNGISVDRTPVGYYVDESIKTIKLPPLKKGCNTLIITLPLGVRTNTEWCYVLGDFGVKAEGACKRIIPKPERLAFDSIAHQGYPFYGGNVIYEMDIETAACDVCITTAKYRGALIKVFVDGVERGTILYAPYRLNIDGLPAGRHTIGLKLFGNRYNSFGPVHNCREENHSFVTPDYWRTEGDDWCYEYVLGDVGIMKSPRIEIFERE